jgi:hypothetical protein
MIRERRFAAAATLALALALTTACAPDPAPTPSPTGFASQEEAFAAAEATYRAYVDALNAVDLSDPATFEAGSTSPPVSECLRQELTRMHMRKGSQCAALPQYELTPDSGANSKASPGRCLLDVSRGVSRTEVVGNFADRRRPAGLVFSTT